MAKASDFEGKRQDELFYFVDYSPEEAERVGYSNYLSLIHISEPTRP